MNFEIDIGPEAGLSLDKWIYLLNEEMNSDYSHAGKEIDHLHIVFSDHVRLRD